ncbi:MAG: hypothetical protein KAR20_03790, partial [Candidatus Heimdallarchaeota archaeon]|nr:hypothetical protein [Candidatus Heimdallarchaeota archaeon]
IEAEWEYEYHEDTDEIPTDEEMKKYGKTYNPPEYFFVIDVYGQRFGENQESNLLEFKDWIEIELKEEVKGPFGGEEEEENPFANEEYVVTFADGSEQRGNLDENGMAKAEDVPPGKIKIEFPQL